MNQEDGGAVLRSDLQIGVDGPMANAVSVSVPLPLPLPGLAGEPRQDAAARIEVRVGYGVAALLALEHDWRALAASLPHPAFTDSFEWQRAYLECLESNPGATCYVSLFDSGRAIAIFPLRRVRRSVGWLPLWMWELPTHPHLALCDPLLSPDWNAAVLVRSLLRALDENLDLRWDALHMPNLPDDAVIVRARLAELLPLAYQERSGCSMYFECSSLESALANCSSSFTRNLRRQGRKLAQQGTVTMTLARRGAELDAAFAEFLRLEASGWKGAAGRVSAIALHPRLLNFYLDLKNRFAAVDSCLISLLKLDGVAIAAQFCLLSGPVLYVQKIAYDEARSAEAPGNQLMYRLLDHCCNDPAIERLSLVTGPSWAVGRWNPEALDVWEIHVFRRSFRGVCGLFWRQFRAQLWAPARRQWRRLAAARIKREPAAPAQ